MKFLKSFSVYSVVSMYQAALMFSMITIFSNLMPIEEFGKFNLLLAISTFIFHFAIFNSNGVVNLFFHKVNLEKFKLYISHTILYIFPLTSIVIFVVYLLFMKDINILFNVNNEKVWFYLLLYVISQVIPIIMFSYFQTRERINLFLKYASSYYTLRIVAMVTFYYLYEKLESVFIGFIAISFIYSIIGIYILLKDNVLTLNLKKEVILDIFSYSSVLVLSALLMSYFFISDRLLISHYFGNNDLAVYSIAINICMAISIFINAFSQAWAIYLFKELKKDNYNVIKLKKIIYLVVLLFLILPLIIYLVKDLFFLFYDNKYYVAVEYILLVGYVFAFMGIRSIFQGFLHFSKKTFHIMSSVMTGLIIFYLLSYFYNDSMKTILINMLSSIFIMTLIVFIHTNMIFKLWGKNGKVI